VSTKAKRRRAPKGVRRENVVFDAQSQLAIAGSCPCLALGPMAISIERVRPRERSFKAATCRKDAADR